jgi:predicted DNA-binding transcriptional regulator AlpA
MQATYNRNIPFDPPTWRKLAEIAERIAPAQGSWLADRVRNTHGLQLSQEDKRDMARKIYAQTPHREREGKKARLAQILSVSLSTVYDWLSRIDKDARDAQTKRIFDAWLRVDTNAAIAQREGLTEEAIRQRTQEFPDVEKLGKPEVAYARHAVDFDPPLYNVWKQQEKSSGSEHFGNSA